MYLIQDSMTGLASHLVYEGLLDDAIAKDAYEKAKREQLPFVSFIVKNNLIDSDSILQSCSKTFGLTIFNLDNYEIDWLNHLPLSIDILFRYHAVPLYKQNGILHIGIADPTDRTALDVITFHTGSRVQAVLVAEDQLTQLLEKYLNTQLIKNNLELNLINKITLEDSQNLIQESTVNYDEPLIRFADNIIQHAIHHSVSDIHIEPYENFCRIRYRQDGILSEVTEIPNQLTTRLVARLKILAKLDISERRLPQDGRFQAYNRDIRINTCPTVFGEKIVLRLLNANNMALDASQLGLSESQCKLFFEKISQPQGMILVTGPTGSGKTITLYTALNYLNTTEKNISTVEDPVEIQLKGINQVNIHSKIGLQFTTVLRTLLRQDPDIIMIGEIRDTETAEIAIQAAHTGHLVLSTLHTNSAIEAITRLRAMGIAPYHIASSVSLIIAQRLIRKLCEHCKQPEIIPQATLINMGFNISLIHSTFYRAVGCQHCLQGYKGRIGIYELLPITESLTHYIVAQAPTHSLHEQAEQEKFVTLKQSGFEKAACGLTSLTELHRVLNR